MARLYMRGLRRLKLLERTFLLLTSIVILFSLCSLREEIVYSGETLLAYLVPGFDLKSFPYQSSCLNYEGIDYCHQTSPANEEFFYKPPASFQLSEKDRNAVRAEAVKEAFIHSWGSYKKHAWGHDNVGPLTNRQYNE
ncbi:hypothetical protein DSO57_1019330 [Entomophthora muscae]|uniref:Uncharacterized protein n=1 Tax=Entomophthora muscae TaxID=34485 RepID=A0ACC2TRN2_9FUNG|nr:hypothetical protein DSO57_1019330 [Entomophthora muscae]